MITHINSLDMVPGGKSLFIVLNQYDADFELCFNLYARTGEFYIDEGSSVAIRGTKPDGTGYSVDCSLAGNVVTVAGDVQITAVAGRGEFELTLYNADEEELNTANFFILVERAALDRDTVASDNVLRELYDVEDNIEDILLTNQLYEEFLAELQSIRSDVEEELADIEIDPDDLGLYQDPDTYYVYPTFKGVASSSGIPLSASGGGGSGGSSTSAVMTASNTSGWLSKTIASGAECDVTLTWSSLEDGISTGSGTLTLKVNDVKKFSKNIAQGSVTVSLGDYLSAGSNACQVIIEDAYGQTRTIRYTITVVELTISSTFDATQVYSSAISFAYTPVGKVEKTVYFYLDGSLLDTNTTSVSNRQLTQTIAAQSHGAHTLRVYFTATVDGEVVTSNELWYNFICIESGNTMPVIASSFSTSTASQYTTLQIPFLVYDPSSLTAPVTITINGTQVSSQTVDRTEQTYSYRADSTGTLTIVLASGTATKTLTCTITESEVDVEAETSDLVLHLTSQGRSNSEADPSVWEDEDNNISCTLTGFNFSNDGWQADSDGATVLRVSGDGRVGIHYQPFASDFRTTGKTIELEFSTRNVLNYDATILSCMSGGRGITVTAQKATLTSEQSSISTQFKENEHVRIAFVTEKKTENRLQYIYINGIMSGAIQYPEDDDFSQATPVDISIGSNYCTMDLYRIRIYDNDLTRFQILENWIADTQDGATMLERYQRNNVYDAYGSIVIANLPSDLPYMIISCEELPQYKGDKKTCSVTFDNPLYPSRSFTATNVQIDVQGTSSQYYARKNYKLKFRDGFVMTASGTTTSTYAMNSDAIATNVFCMKKDVASSEGANNVELVRLYNSACPYKTPAQEENSKVRQGIDGFPIVIFWNDTANSTTSFLGKYNFNNDKSTEEVFGFGPGDESWEIENNTSSRVLWKSADYSDSDWLNDFEARYPDTDPAYEDATQLAEFAAWVASTDTTAATGDALDSSYTDCDGTVHTVDNAAYRLAKFKTELEDYCEKDSALFYYLFTACFLMVDSRAKNAFPSFIGEEVTA